MNSFYYYNNIISYNIKSKTLSSPNHKNVKDDEDNFNDKEDSTSLSLTNSLPKTEISSKIARARKKWENNLKF